MEGLSPGGWIQIIPWESARVAVSVWDEAPRHLKIIARWALTPWHAIRTVESSSSHVRRAPNVAKPPFLLLRIALLFGCGTDVGIEAAWHFCYCRAVFLST